MNILGLLILAALAMQVQGMVPSTKAAFTPVRNPCESCIAIVEDAENYLADPHTQDAIVGFVQDNVCSLLPSDSSRTCTQEARVFVAQGIASLEQSLTPSKVCTYLGSCGAQALSAAAGIDIPETEQNALGFPLECPLCRVVMTKLLDRLRDADSRDQMRRAALAACQNLADSAVIAKCNADVEQLFASLGGLVNDIDSNQACHAMQFCAEEGTLSRNPVPESLAKLGTLWTMAITVPQRKADQHDCDSCKRIIGEAVAVLMVSSYWIIMQRVFVLIQLSCIQIAHPHSDLQDPDNQKELIDFAKNSCEAFDQYKEQCREYVELYGPMLIGIAVSYLQPGPLCNRLGYCPSPDAVRI